MEVAGSFFGCVGVDEKVFWVDRGGWDMFLVEWG